MKYVNVLRKILIDNMIVREGVMPVLTEDLKNLFKAAFILFALIVVLMVVYFIR